ncbi:hypothetical protein CYA84_08640 [Campylobacter coli]|nr:hypothetical protein [Campylobacter coli]
MPVISNYQRYAGVCARLAGFGQDSFILDNRALNSDFVEINPNNSDIPAQTNELTAGSPSFYNQYLLKSLDWAGGAEFSSQSNEFRGQTSKETVESLVSFTVKKTNKIKHNR